MPLEEPTVSELVRRVQASVEDVASDVRELKDLQANFVPRELYVIERDGIRDRLTKLETKRQTWWTVVALPVMVGVILWFLQGVVAK